MTVNELAYLTMADASALLHKRAVSAEDLARHYLGAIERLDPLLNAFLSVEPEDVLAQARRADAERSAGAGRRRLHGLPYALKDLIDVQGRLTTCHSKIRAHHRAPQDATVVRRLADEGMVLLGKTALHEFATGGPCRDLPWPPALNPWDRLRHPGGSSSGSAVAVAMDMAPASIGTDTGGSVRNPATCCGLVGMKPTYGVVSRFGVFPLAPSLDHVGPLTRTVEDNAMLLQAMVGTDPADPTSVRHPDCDFLKGIHLPLAGLRIGLVENFHERQFHPAPEMVEALQAAARRIETLGAQVDSTNLAPLQEWRECGVGIQQYEQYRIHAQWLRERAQDYCQASRQKLAAGAHIDAAMYARLQARRLQLVAGLQETFQHFDALLVISSHDLPCPIDDQAEVARTYSRQARMPFNVAGNPALAVPTGFSASGLPLGMQIVGRPFEEALLYRIAARFLEDAGWSARRPPQPAGAQAAA